MMLSAVRTFRPNLFVTCSGHHSDGHCVAMALGFGTGSTRLSPVQMRLLQIGAVRMQSPEVVLEA